MAADSTSRCSDGSALPLGIHVLHNELTQFSRFEKELEALRKELASAQGVPPYVVFSDATLEEMAARRPTTAEEFLTVGGVGETKLARYGEEFLRVLAA